MKILGSFFICITSLCIATPGKVLFLKGTPYEIGYKHGLELKDQIKRNVSNYVEPALTSAFYEAIPQILTYVSSSLKEEMKGLADGSGIPLEKIHMLNLFPEMFHCSGITAKGNATKDGKLYHVRVLDYAVGKDLQNTAVLFIVKPEGKHAFLNVSYAGFIGSITGMNEKKIAVGEIGGKGYGDWNGTPMAFLIREILENASSLEGAKEILKNSPRTCEYFYVLSDGNDGSSSGVYATSKHIEFLAPDSDEILAMVGNSHVERYPILRERISQNYGNIDEKTLQEIIKKPVARPSNLHNAIFCPQDLKVWISHTGEDGSLACENPYEFYALEELLKDN